MSSRSGPILEISNPLEAFRWLHYSKRHLTRQPIDAGYYSAYTVNRQRQSPPSMSTSSISPAPDQPLPVPRPDAATTYLFDLDGGRACLDFANTRGFDPTSPDHLTHYADLVNFAAQSDLITPEDADWLRAQSEREPTVAAGVLTRARKLRDAVRTIFLKVAAGETPPESALSLLNFDLAASLSHARVVPTGNGDGYRWGWSGRNLDAPLWPITRSAADVLTSAEERSLVRECGADTCAWLFMDTTRNRSRQWCSMQSCGNREKARRHYQRVRQRRAPSATATTTTTKTTATATAD